MKQEAFDHLARAFVPMHVAPVARHHKRVADRRGRVDRLLTVRLEQIERIEGAAQLVIDTGDVERINDDNAMTRTLCAESSRPGGVLAFGVQHQAASRP